MIVQEFARKILFGNRLEDKLFWPESIEFDDTFKLIELPKLPAREDKIQFSDQQLKFPKSGTLNLEDKKAVALNSFANHELLAIEMMAAALLIFPQETQEQTRMKRGIIGALRDEQVHFQMYRNRMNEIGYDFGDFPLNDFFWKQMPSMTTPEKFFAVMSLTFEAANLDFAKYYEGIFKSFDDHKTAGILKKVYEDEVSHVALGVTYLNKWREDKDLFQYYLETLPFPMTPDRSKGIHFLDSARLQAGMTQDFVDKVKNYKDDFDVTKRKSWKK